MQHLTPEKIRNVIALADRLKAARSVDDSPDFVTPSQETFDKAFKPQPEKVELREFIAALSKPEQFELQALMWLGRGDDRKSEHFPAMVKHAKDTDDDGTPRYIASKPHLATYLRDGLKKLGL